MTYNDRQSVHYVLMLNIWINNNKLDFKKVIVIHPKL